MKHIVVLGSTGSIGTQTLDVVRYQGDTGDLCTGGRKQYRTTGGADQGVPSEKGGSLGGRKSQRTPDEGEGSGCL